MNTLTRSIKALVLLTFYWSIFFLALSSLASLSVPVFFYLKTGNFRYNWNELSYAATMGVSVGATLGAGIWILAKIEEFRKRKIPPSDPQ